MKEMVWVVETRETMPEHDHLIVIGASAGSMEVLIAIARGLPPDLAAAVCIVRHIPPHSPSMLPNILSRRGVLPTSDACDQEPIMPGHIYVAPPDQHLLVRRGHFRVTRGPRETLARPAVDPLFRTAAHTYGPRVIGVVLSGALNDGTSGLLAIKRLGGIAIVQDPETALVPAMPASALEYVQVDHCVAASDIAALLVRLTRVPVSKEMAFAAPSGMEYEINISEPGKINVEKTSPPGELAGLVCPECGGPLWELRDGELLRYRCRLGHGFTGEGVLDGKYDAVEQALSTALETLTESERVATRLAKQSHDRHHPLAARHFDERARKARQRAEIIRQVLEDASTQSIPVVGSPTPATAEDSPPTPPPDADEMAL
jgi:two-component system chemotaxis response regulator CheB